MRQPSLRLRLMLAAALSAILTLAFIGLLIANLFNRQIENRFRENLSLQLDQLAAHLVVAPNDKVALDTALSDPRYERPLSGLYWEIDEAGNVPLRSRSLWDKALDISVDHAGADLTVVPLRGPDGEALMVMSRVVTMRGVAQAKHHYLLTIAEDAAISAADYADLFRTLMIGLGLGFLAIIAAAYAQIVFGLKPLEAIRRDVERVRGGLKQNVETSRVPSEILPLAEEINATLSSHRQNLERARRHAGDLAHGLKTPLAALAGQADLLSRAGHSDNALAINAHLNSMHRHVERELARARAQGDGTVIGTGVIALPEIRSIIATLQKLASEREIHFQVKGSESVFLAMNPDDFAEVLGNLIDNARKWAKSLVFVSVNLDGAMAIVSVEDDGPGIKEQEKTLARARGIRLDEKVQGSGLGLSIVEALLENYHSKLELGRADAGGLRASFMIAVRRQSI